MTRLSNPRPLQLLSPARDLKTGLAAIAHGADAIYIGPDSFGARARAGNSIADIERLVNAAMPWHIPVLATVNTIIYDDELNRVTRLVRDLYNAGVDALIVQDMALLELDLPPIALHASTQCDTRTPQQARLLADLGFSQIVIARETSLDETRAIAEAAAPARIEAFVHGALCVCYNGDCQASLVSTGRSANRGECAQMCRLSYTLTDGNGDPVGSPAHYLSLRDLNRISWLNDMANAGVSSFKIEGRLKEPNYVKNVTAAYRLALDRLIAEHPDRYCRASAGDIETAFIPDLDRTFNRRYTSYFIDGRPANGIRMASPATPKAVGQPVGRVISTDSKGITARLNELIANGDGLTYITADGKSGGFRVNRADGSRLTLHGAGIKIPPGTPLYRNYDKAFDDMLSAPVTSRRTIPVTLTLRRADKTTIAVDALLPDGRTVSVTATAADEPARTSDNGRRADNLARLGGTQLRAVAIDDRLGHTFVPISVISRLRQSLADAVRETMLMTFAHETRLPRKDNPQIPDAMKADRHKNISNQLAIRHYTRLLGSDAKIEPALEIDPHTRKSPELTVMTTRYCLRRELGRCLCTPDGHKLTGPLHLHAPGIDWRLDFDCQKCLMRVIANPTY